MDKANNIIVVEIPDDCEPPKIVRRYKLTVIDDDEARKPPITDRNL
jgi:hypothetical protein